MATPKKYDPAKIERKWQRTWKKDGIYEAKERSGKKKCYVLDMFPYPSGDGLHVGHPKGYIATDVYSRFKRMNGFNALHPMGWDAFGLPAENFAIKNKVHPRKAVEKNIKRFKEQLSIIGFNYDWSREINTTDPEYYKWTQWIFLKLHERGLAYQSFEPINWCPSCQTGLANEDLENGACERCGTAVEKKPMRQWVLRITDYADRLLGDLDALEWPESIKESQRNWIGRSEGAELEFGVAGTDRKIRVFTTRPDTLYGATYVVLAPEHPLVDELKGSVSNWKDVDAYRAKARAKDEIERTAQGKEKTGVPLKGVMAVNPASGEEIPVWTADYVLAHYGTGAIMAVPAHDERDYEFAKKYKLPVRQVVEPAFVGESGDGAVAPGLPFVRREAVCAVVRNPKNGSYLVNSWKAFRMHGLFTGGVEAGEDAVEAARREVLEETGYKNLKFRGTSPISINTFFYHRVKKQNRHAHFRFVFFDLVDEERDPIDEKEAAIHEALWRTRGELEDFFTVFEGQFLLKLIDNPDYVHTGPGLLANSAEFDGMDNAEAARKIVEKAGGAMKTTYKLRDWVFSRQRYWGEPIPMIHCESCGTVPVPEKDLPVKLPQVEQYAPTGTGESPLAAIDTWVNVRCPKCKGKAKRETNTMPQWAGSSWYYLRYMDPKNPRKLVDPKKEKHWAPVDMYVGGAEHATRHLIYARFWHKFLHDIGVVSTAEPFARLHHVGLILAEDGRKMSKRYGNVVNPDDVVERFGADTLRVYEMFMGPFSQSISWSTDNMVGARRFIEKVWRLGEKVARKGTDNSQHVHRTVKKVTADIDGFAFNTAISAMMILVNELEKAESVPAKDYETLLKLLAPFAPHVTEELWASLGHTKSIHLEQWPAFDESKIASSSMTIVLQVNGKARGTFEMPEGASEEEVKARALSLSEAIKWLEDREPKRIVYVKGRLINIVV